MHLWLYTVCVPVCTFSALERSNTPSPPSLPRGKHFVHLCLSFSPHFTSLLLYVHFTSASPTGLKFLFSLISLFLFLSHILLLFFFPLPPPSHICMLCWRTQSLWHSTAHFENAQTQFPQIVSACVCDWANTSVSELTVLFQRCNYHLLTILVSQQIILKTSHYLHANNCSSVCAVWKGFCSLESKCNYSPFHWFPLALRSVCVFSIH